MTESAACDTISLNGGDNLKIVGKIDLDKFRRVSAGIRTDEVILTDERAAHIIERRGVTSFEEYYQYFSKILSDPDYIFADKEPYTVIISKVIDDTGGAVNIVLRLAVESDSVNYRNSIITAIYEGQRRFTRTLRNGRLIYDKTVDGQV